MKKNFSPTVLMIILGIFFCTRSLCIVAQSDIPEGDKPLVKQADTKFKNKDYFGAFDVYNQLYETSPENLYYNYRLGICALLVKENKSVSIRYLEFAAKNFDPHIINEDVFYYLGKAYMLTYQFDKAIHLFTSYRAFFKETDSKQKEISHLIEMCSNAKIVNEAKTEWEINKKTTVSRDSVLKKYESMGVVGKIEYSIKYNYVKIEDDSSSNKKAVAAKTGLKPYMDFYNTELDYLHRDDEDQPTLFMSKEYDKIVLSSYGTIEGYGKDIYVINKVFDNKWTEAEAFPGNVNTIYDENFPFLSADRKTLYFSSQGHNSMGGYDIFKTEFDANANTWSNPVNLGPPFNSPADDILFAAKDGGQTLYFASTRNTPIGQITIYRLNRKGSSSSGTSAASEGGNKTENSANSASEKGKKGNGSSTVVIKGKIGNPKDNYSITVIDLKTNKVVGTYNPDSVNGDYKMKLSKGGKYMFNIKSKSLKPETKIIEIPANYEGDTLNQQIISSGGNSTLVSDYLVNSLPGVKDLYYTIQIGSFSKLVSDTTIFLDIQPFYYSISDDGQIKYFVGIYNNLEYAQSAKLKAKELGISQCFIVPFYNSQRIEIDDARKYEKQGMNAETTYPNMNHMPYINR